MAIKPMDTQNNKAYRDRAKVSKALMDANPEQGGYVEKDANGYLVAATGNVPAFMFYNESIPGHKNVNAGVGVYQWGKYSEYTTMYDTSKTYAFGTPLKVVKQTTGAYAGQSILAPVVLPADAALPIQAYADGAPSSDGYLKIYSAGI